MLEVVVLIVIGLCLGSFVNALVWRLHIQQEMDSKLDKNTKSVNRFLFRFKTDNPYSIINGRSMCPHCHHELAIFDLIPVISWVLLRGKCRYCDKPISWQYPVVELLLMSLFVVSFLLWPMGFNSLGQFSFVIWLAILTGFVALAVYDLKWFLLPDRIVYPLIGLAIFEVLWKATFFGEGWNVITQAFWAVLAIAGTFYLIYVVSNGKWIGFGDVKLAIVLGLIVANPFRALLIIFIASIIGSVIATPLLLRGKAKMSSQIPFGPYLLTAVVLVVIFGNDFVNWYNSFFYLR